MSCPNFLFQQDMSIQRIKLQLSKLFMGSLAYLNGVILQEDTDIKRTQFDIWSQTLLAWVVLNL